MTRLPPAARVISTRGGWVCGDAGMVTCSTPSAYSAVGFSKSTPSPTGSCRVNDPWGSVGDNDLLAFAVARGGVDRQGAALYGHLDTVRVDAGQVGLNVVAAVLAAVHVQWHAKRGPRPACSHGQEQLPKRGRGKAQT
jgi:hypothetical protein